MRAISRWSGNTNGRQVLLSVCIPTYNRAQYLEKAIRSIIAQADPRDVDIVIVDNHSTDETEAVIAQFAGENFDISYTKRELNVGADRNVIEVGDYSTGEYFWIFGSDDTMPPGSVEQVLRSIATYRPNLILGDAYDCDLQLNQTGYLKFLRCGERQFDFSERGDVYSFLEATTMTASLFGYISSMVFKREIWDQVTPSRYAIGSAYPQVYRALGIVFGAPGKFHYLAQPIANNRRNNCSYTEEFGEILRYMIDLRMFRIVIDEYFSSDLQIRNRFKKFVRACFGRMAYERIRTGIVAMDELIEFFEADDAVMPQINHWVLHPVVERAYRRFQENGIEQQCFSGKSILHIGYRHQGSAILKPINRKAIGIEPGFSGYDGVHLPYETASQDTLYACNFFPQKSDEGSVFREWMRVLRDGAYIVITNSLGPAGDHSHDVKISTILASIEAALPVDHFQIVHCSQSFPDPAAPQVSEVDIVVRKLASLTASSSLTPDQAAPAKVEAMQVAAPAELLAQALRSHSSGDGDNAAMLAQKVLQSEPRNGVALQLLGLIAYQKSDHALAIIRFSDALKVGPSSADVYLNLGCAYAALGGNGEAIECFTTALKLRPGFGSAQANLAILRAAEGKDDASRQNFLQVLAQSPQLTEAHSLLNMKVPA